MTLIISLVSKRVVVHVSDTRFTSFDRITERVLGFEDGKVKSIVIQSDRGCFLVSYCGLGRILNQRTDHWLHDQLINLDAGKRDILDISNELLTILKEKIKPTNEYQKLSVSISGFAITGETAGVVQYLISNFEKVIEGKLKTCVVGAFDLAYLIPKANIKTRKSYSILINGADQATVSNVFDRRMKKIIKIFKGWDESKNSRFILFLIELIKISTSHSIYGKYISESCLITILPASSWEPECIFYNPSLGAISRAPHVIGADLSYKDIECSDITRLTLKTSFKKEANDI